MRILLSLALLIALAGCEQAPSDEQLTTLPAPDGIENPPPAPGRPAPATLEGDWRVAGIDGEALDTNSGLALTADDEELWWEPRCFGAIRGYVIVGDAITFGSRTSTPPAVEGTPPPVVCLIAPPPGLHEVMQAIDAAENIETTPNNGVRISGGGRSVTLFRQ
ncbi:hypothetical protein [Aurantiacibacter sediminis]|uniref:META domain-containing protein n=1 Tax=Aurantiacibacter sediminis TaxID=2793064 RepID=A0ABS0N106_9SPHN|nr:hypothetical protein [Aurantiacibacter sediminis]MBH5321653.1 hypothetical protein [Aurantiacibacter sediminis]